MHYDRVKVVAAYKSLIGWENHYDTAEIPPLSPALNVSDSGEFYNDDEFMRLNFIDALKPTNYSMDDYLTKTVDRTIVTMMNDLLDKRRLRGGMRSILEESVLINKYGFTRDTVENEERFVGWKIRVKTSRGLLAAIKRFTVQATAAQTDLPIYIFHTSQVDPIATFNFNSTQGTSWSWQAVEQKLFADNENFTGGEFYIGYYQEDLNGKAINANYDFESGPCDNCTGTHHYKRWQAITSYYDVCAFFVPSSKFTKGEMFDIRDAYETYSNNFGINMAFSIECDITDFLIDNRFSMVTPLKWGVKRSVLQFMKTSQQLNYVSDDMRALVIRELEGDKETNAYNITQRYMKALGAANMDFNRLHAECVPCKDDSGINIGAI